MLSKKSKSTSMWRPTTFLLPLFSLASAGVLFCHLRFNRQSLKYDFLALKWKREDATTIVCAQEQMHNICGSQRETNLSLDVRCGSTPRRKGIRSMITYGLFSLCDKNATQDKAIATPNLLTTSPRLVLDTLTPLPTTRKCFRMINGVLVERTVGDVLPQLQSNADNMNKVLVELAKQYKTKQDDMEKWKVRIKACQILLTPVVQVKESR
jgi:hypothetical protein